MKITEQLATVIPQSPLVPELDPDEVLFDIDTSDPSDLSHNWIVAATIRVNDKIAKHADLRGSFVTDLGQRILALEVYCEGCRRPYDEVADTDCESKIDNSPFIGGDPGVRKKRKAADNSGIGQWVPAPQIRRLGGAESLVHGDS